MIILLKMIMSIMLWDSPLLALKKQASMLCATIETATQQGRESSLCPTASKEMNAANAMKSDGSEHWERVHTSAREQQQHWQQKANLKQPVKEQSYRTSHSICLPRSSHGDPITEAIYGFNAIHISIFIEKKILKFIWNHKRWWISKAIQ